MASKSLNALILGSLLRKNVMANYLGAVASIVGPLISLPFYLSFLGHHQYGLIGFILLIQASLNLLDVGLGQALVREVAIYLGEPDGKLKVSRLIFNLERFYWGLALILTLAIAGLSGFISTHWLKLSILPVSQGVLAVCGAALIFLFQFPGALYRSFLIGSQSQVELNKILVIVNIFRHVGGVLLVFVYPSLATYIAWHALLALVETVCRRAKVIEILGISKRLNVWSLGDFLYFMRQVRGLSFAVWFGALFAQLDKLIVSKMLPIEEFGYFSISSSVSLGLLQLIYPVFQATQPKAVELRENPIARRQLYMKLFMSILLLFTVVLLGFFFVGQVLLSVWLRQADVANHVYGICLLLLIGSALNGLYSVGYMDWIVTRKPRVILTVNFISLLLVLTVLPMSIGAFGLKGAAAGWILINLVGFLCSLGWLRLKENR